jgi:hypothetical protein
MACQSLREDHRILIVNQLGLDEPRWVRWMVEFPKVGFPKEVCLMEKNGFLMGEGHLMGNRCPREKQSLSRLALDLQL